MRRGPFSLALALALALALVAACASTAPLERAADSLLLVNARLWEAPGYDALRVEGGQIRELGTSDALRTAFPEAQVLDASGGWVLPGFHDAHVHMRSGGEALGALALAELDSLAALQAALRAHAAESQREWLTGRGWQYDLLPPGALPTRQMLDTVESERPVYLESYDGHAGWANSRALALAGVDALTPDPPDGRIARESDGATPQGTLLEGAMQLVERALPRPSRAEQLAALRRAVAHCAALGITSVNDFASNADELELYAELAARGELPLEVSVSLPLEGDLERYAALRARFASNPRVGWLKGFVDGVIESKTAYLLEPYAGSESERGKPRLPPARLYELVRAAHERGFPVALHAIGDGAVRLALDTFERVQRELPEIALRHRIEHIEVIDAADLPRFRALGVTASMQPFHANPFGDTPDAGVWSRNLGAARLRHSFAWRELVQAGAPLVFGSDWPVMSADPLQGLAVAVTRQDARGRPAIGWNPQQKLDVEEALEAYDEGRRIAPGEPAELVVLQPGVELRRPSTLWQGQRVRWVLHSGQPLAPGAGAAAAP